jgi:hypothetical protein
VRSYRLLKFGQIELMRPREYPLSDFRPFSSRMPPFGSKDPVPRIADRSLLHVLSSAQVKSRPTELYLGAFTKDKQMVFWASCDTNVYEEDLVEGWLGEFKAAAEWYLGGGVQQQQPKL